MEKQLRKKRTNITLFADNQHKLMKLASMAKLKGLSQLVECLAYVPEDKAVTILSEGKASMDIDITTRRYRRFEEDSFAAYNMKKRELRD